ncbi:Nucleotide-binding universal stress protein, UspA family [Salinimicrobium catena]|uniref:Nucleotide-binding universal stress protein, UspA family n=1 Tax=Salinimicrobium catena TaxID=390640 RepID=A0A1H5MZN5_9FLAO|nr:universal stress protein [Salinimicrobium catena]SDL33097.1 Nucleotide-binding universal stress protein, UspA family [Salinimicrobium catena]SEE94650.1 Nucleotide-binding universal stress protein, UspA family [Salinimicrobium catena]
MKHVLLPTDFSENSYNAIKYALQLLSEEECTFHLLNTYTPILYDNEYLVYSATQPTLTEIYKNNSLRGLNRILKRIKKNFPNEKHEFKRISSFNMLSDEIKEQVKEKEIDLVVMGTKGATNADEILLGTHTVHAIKKTKCPLLAIPAHFEYRPPKEILFPSDYETDLPPLLEILQEIAARNASNIHILHVYFGPSLSEEQEKRKKALGEFFKDQGHHFYSIADKSVPQAIYDFQEDNEIDLLVMINNKHSFFENLLFRPVVNEIGFHVKTPFLVIPSGKKR